jgi:hypothetical protein
MSRKMVGEDDADKDFPLSGYCHISVLTYVNQSKVLVASECYHTAITSKTPVNRMTR